jgi:hypothetical protein
MLPYSMTYFIYQISDDLSTRYIILLKLQFSIGNVWFPNLTHLPGLWTQVVL